MQDPSARILQTTSLTLTSDLQMHRLQGKIFFNHQLIIKKHDKTKNEQMCITRLALGL